MHKLEIHTTEEGLARLNLINRSHLVKTGYYRVDSKILSGKYGSSLPDIKIEAFISQLSVDLISLLEADDLIYQYNLTECTQTYLFESLISDAEQEKVPPAMPEISPKGHSSIETAPIDIQIKALPSGKLKLTLQSNNTTFFLCKVVGVLAQNDVLLEKAQTFPQSDHIVGIFVIPHINMEQLSYIKDQLSQELAATQMGNCGYKKFSRAAISPEELQISLDTSGSMASLKIRCNHNDIHSRFAILEAISLYDQEITISRLGGLGKKIEDTYYVKPVKDIFITNDIVNQITKHITGNK